MVELDHNELVVVSGMDCVVVVPKMGLELGELDHNEVVVHELVEVEVAENSQGSGVVVEEDGHNGGGGGDGEVVVVP